MRGLSTQPVVSSKARAPDGDTFPARSAACGVPCQPRAARRRSSRRLLPPLAGRARRSAARRDVGTMAELVDDGLVRDIKLPVERVERATRRAGDAESKRPLADRSPRKPGIFSGGAPSTTSRYGVYEPLAACSAPIASRGCAGRGAISRSGRSTSGCALRGSSSEARPWPPSWRRRPPRGGDLAAAQVRSHHPGPGPSRAPRRRSAEAGGYPAHVRENSEAAELRLDADTMVALEIALGPRSPGERTLQHRQDETRDGRAS